MICLGDMLEFSIQDVQPQHEYQSNEFLETFNVVPAGTLFMISEQETSRHNTVSSMYRIFLDKSKLNNYQHFANMDPFLRLSKKSTIMLLHDVSLESPESEIGESLLVPCVFITSSSTRIGSLKYADFMAIMDYTLGILPTYDITMTLPSET